MSEWEADHVVTGAGVVVPVRATARRPSWEQLPAEARHHIERQFGSAVVSAWSAGTGFTPGFASRLSLADGRDVFVKAASSADDRAHGWPLSDAYRSEVRKLHALPPGVGAPPLLWDADVELGGEQWAIAAFAAISGAPPRRPWRDHQLRLVLDKLAAVGVALTPAPPSIALDTVQDELLRTVDERHAEVRNRDGDSPWLDTIIELCTAAERLLDGETLVHMDLRDDNILIDDQGEVWFVDWNWPVVGAPWIDLVCVLLSARGDGFDVEAVLASHPLSRDVDPYAITCLLAVLWSFWAVGSDKPAPESSPHLRDHQRWYLDVTRDWLESRLGLGL